MKLNLKHYIGITALLLIAIKGHGQTSKTYQDTTITNLDRGYNTILIKPNTSIAPGAGQVVHLYALPSGCSALNTAFSTAQNYIVTSVPRQENYVAGQSGYTTCQVMQTVQYIDGLGRPLQTVQVKGNPTATRDVVQPVAYDLYGREATKYLPYTTASNDGSYKPTAITDQPVFYGTPTAGVATISSPFSQTIFEASPLNRVTEQGAPGTPWQPGSNPANDHTIRIAYATNDGTTYWAKQYDVTIDGSGNRTLSTSKNYDANSLYVTVTANENYTGSGRENTTEEYKDKEGHVVLKRTFNLNASNAHEVLSTYYVYDDLGNLVFVLPPGSNADNTLPDATALNNFCYQYKYDERNRVSQKRLPGKDWEYLVYNQLDQPVLSQDAVQRGNNQWTVTKYDAMGRVIITGLWNAGAVISQATLQASIYATAQWDTRDLTNNATADYIVSSYPAISKVLTTNYYDNYNIPGLPSTYSITSGNNATGLLIASKTAVLNTINNAAPDMLWTVHYYDDKGRNITTYAQHYLGGTVNNGNYDLITITYDFTNEVTATNRQHYVNGSPALTVANTYAYDHMGRKTKTYEQINGGTNVLLSQIDYNDIGQVMTKHLGNDLQQVAYTYNERGWLRTANSSSNFFNLDLRYNSPEAGVTQQFNGNIAEMLYSGKNSGSKTLKFAYDPLNRLTNSVSSDGTLNEQIGYDLMGNITQLNRGGQAYSTLNYSYENNNQSNHLSSVTGSGFSSRSYAYDANGNATTDGMTKGITYNLLNLPQTVTQNGTALAAYTYDANGQKLRSTGSDGNWDYISGIIYHNGVIDNIQTEEGRAIPANGYTYQYHLKDHLGNVRSSFYKNTTANTTDVIQESEYYAFGLNRTLVDNGNKYLYNNKEKQIDLNNQFDYGARFYDPVIARWGHIDPKAELYFQITPYAYAANTPVNAIDPDGHLVIFVAGQNTGGGGTHKYWDNPKTGKAFDWEVQWHFNDLKPARYYEGGGWNNTFVEGESSNLNLGNRVDAGHLEGTLDAESIIKSLSRTGGVITESIKVVAHSMGAAYAKGLITAIIEYAKAHPEECRGLSITEYDFAAYQQNHLSAIPGVPLYQFDNEGDGVVGGILGFLMGGSHHAKEKGREEKGSNDNVNPDGGHAIADFIKAVGTLEAGTYKFIDGKFVKQEDKK
jgi:RHS repeat-associated protein